MRSALPALAAILIGCVDLDIQQVENTPPVGQHPILNPRFAAELQPIFTESCATSSACHAGPAPQRGLDLSAGNSYANLVGVLAAQNPAVQRVNPTKPDSSYLIWKMEADPSRRFGSRMPLSSPAFAPEVVETFRNWIANGAANN